MASLKAQRAAMLVSESIRTGKPKTYGKILKEAGYSDQTSKSPSLVTETESYKKSLAIENIPLLTGIQQEITRIKIAMSQKDLRTEDYRVLVGSLDLLTKNYQLLSGGATERQVFVLPSQVMGRNVIEATQEEKPLLNNGSTEPHKGNEQS